MLLLGQNRIVGLESVLFQKLLVSDQNEVSVTRCSTNFLCSASPSRCSHLPLPACTPRSFLFGINSPNSLNIQQRVLQAKQLEIAF